MILQYGDEPAFAGMHEAYPALRDWILADGHAAAPRGEGTTEVLAASFRIEDAVRRGVPVGCGRKVGVKMMAIDGTGNLAGHSYPDVAIALAPVMGRFADVLEPSEHMTRGVALTANANIGEQFLQGAYGPRIGFQLERVERQLRRDPDTRQAVVSLWREEDADPFWRDRPCTTEFQLMIRGGRLEMFVFMRANDLWTGTCYDVFQFGQVQAAMAHVLGIEHGPYHHYATSLHVYDRDVEKFEAVQRWDQVRKGVSSFDYVPAVKNERESWGPDWDSLAPGEYPDWESVRLRFGLMLESARAGHGFAPRNPVEDWYWTVLSTGRAPR
jgi:thymidylate synthase